MITFLLCFEASACRFYQQPEALIRQLASKTVVLGEVERAAYAGKGFSGERNPWEGVVATKRMLVGQVEEQSFRIDRSGMSTACDDGIPAPRPGETWVLYLAERDGVMSVVYSYPLSVALASDPNLSALLTEDEAR